MSNKQVLGSIEEGSQILINGLTCTVLDRKEEGTEVTTCFPVKRMEFGKTRDYLKSYVREFCNKDFYSILVKAVGKENIIPRKVNLTSDDGSNENVICKDNVSIFTNDDYRRYRKYLPAVDEPVWLATGIGSTTLDVTLSRYICYVGYEGVLVWRSCSSHYGVRPIFTLNSSILVDAMES